MRLPHRLQDLKVKSQGQQGRGHIVAVIPALANAADEWQGYLDTAARDSLPDDISRFWQSLLDADRLTQLD